MRTRSTKAISLFLALVMLLQLSGLAEFTAYATDLSDEIVNAEDGTTETSAEIVEEVTDKREEYSKIYRMSDGTNLAAVYGEPIHYEQNGQWVDIDNSLQATTQTYQIPSGSASITGTYSVNGYTAVGQDDAALSAADSALNASAALQPITPVQPIFQEVTTPMWSNTSNSFGVHLPQTLTENSRVHVSNKGYDLYFGMVLNNSNSGGDAALMSTEIGTATATIAEISNESEDELLRSMENSALSGLTYTDVMPGVDIEYAVRSRTLKETVIIDSPENMPDTLGYTIQAEGLSPVVNEDNSIYFVDENEDTIFVLPAPYMFDSTGELSYDITITLSALSSGEYLLVYELDENWLNDEARVWPVSVDPVVDASNAWANIEDTFVSSKSTWRLQYQLNDMYAGYSATYGKERVYIRFTDLPELQSTDMILSANLYLYGQSVTDGYEIQLAAYAVTSTWDEDTIAWSAQPSCEEEPLDFQIMTDSNEYAHFRWDITAAARRWYYQAGSNNDALGNYGVTIRASTENKTSTAHALLATVDDPGTIDPVLTFTYTNFNGLESYWDYTTQSAGRAGTVYVNNFTGNALVSRTDMSYSGNRMPASVTLNYSVNDRSTNLGYGYGWRLSYAQLITVESTTASGGVSTYYRWTDGDGTNINFYFIAGGEWRDESGQGYNLLIDWDSTNERFCIKDKEGNRLYFDSNGRLTRITNEYTSNNSVTITYTVSDSENLRVSTVTDGVGRVYRFSYTDSTSGNLSSVTYYGTGSTALETVNYEYTSNCPTKVTYADGNSASYSYTARQLTEAFDIELSGGEHNSVRLDYCKDSTSTTIPMVAESMSLVVWPDLINTTEFTYGLNNTKVTSVTPKTDDIDHWCMYQFNGSGNTIAVYNDLGQALYGRYAQDSDSSATANQLVSSSRLQDTVINLLPDGSFEYAHSWMTTGATDETEAHSGQKSVRLSKTEQAVTMTQTVTPGETYTLSGHFKTTDGGTARLTMTAGDTTVTGETVSAADWTRSEITLTIPENVTDVTLSAVQMSSGVVYLDDFQFEKAQSASRYNLVTDGDMTYSVEDDNHASLTFGQATNGVQAATASSPRP